jgi:hypothetical protein
MAIDPPKVVHFTIAKAWYVCNTRDDHLNQGLQDWIIYNF